ncbi:glycosyltransferase family 4 protein [Effusibacillus lacus]|uniref:Glycosyl transferase family 1 n=1 Tax=Effusibacillus lacus TaxID=1348429 RepID=A0A292YII7_9BACL|nr:glycosyltransferase family 4 protein [Effusibacillus lacus]TCS75460.1 glycosyltransferase involved in cell wall biosynthesis [Effusibacillus lacus]GAX88926.1 glycosyl transferase family 1 [Effusibacillus lacus]
MHRVHVMKPDGGEFVHWAFQLNLMMLDACRMLADSGLRFDLIHAHDWLVCYAAKTLKNLFELPLVATIHATEHGRNQGIHTELQRYISSMEWKLTYEAQRVIVCSTYMQEEVERVFQLPHGKLEVIPNGVDPELLGQREQHIGAKHRYAGENERIVLFVGRLVREKGVHTLLEAVPSILADCPEAKVVIAGKGPAKEELEQLTDRLGIRGKVLFAGFVSDEERNRLYGMADVAVFPSLYEPFGIVALEAMAAGVPVVVADVGGLADVVQNGHNGLKMLPGDACSLSRQIRDLLANPQWAKRLAETALNEIGRYNWNRIAQQTIDAYKKVTRKTANLVEGVIS